MKKILVGLVLIGLLSGCSVSAKGGDYPLSTIVEKVDAVNDMVTIEDMLGNRWNFEGCDDWEVGDICAVIMNDNNTNCILDDIIVKAQYCGNIF